MNFDECPTLPPAAEIFAWFVKALHSLSLPLLTLTCKLGQPLLPRLLIEHFCIIFPPNHHNQRVFSPTLAIDLCPLISLLNFHTSRSPTGTNYTNPAPRISLIYVSLQLPSRRCHCSQKHLVEDSLAIFRFVG